MHLDGRIVLPDRVVAGRVVFDTHIRAITPISVLPGAAARRVILPGFIDVHVHGGDGADTMDGAEAVGRMARLHLRHGTTTLLPTTLTRPWPEVCAALDGVTAAMAQAETDPALPRIAGAHLEGPFLSPQRLGAQPPFAVPPSPELVREALAAGCVRVVTLAPELPLAGAAIDAFVAAGVRVSLGHSAVDHEGAVRALAAIRRGGGVAGGTHLFNATAPIEARRPGPVAALLCDEAAYGELILDTHHVHPASFNLALRLLGDRLLLITDAMRATGGPDGPSELGGHAVRVQGGRATLADGTLAGSLLTMDQALRNALAHGIDLPQASRLTSGNAAAYLGLSDRGRIAEGLHADLVVLDEDLAVAAVFVGGICASGAV